MLDLKNVMYAPKDGTVIKMHGHSDTETRKKSYQRCSWNDEFQAWVTKDGWIFFPDYWVKE